MRGKKILIVDDDADTGELLKWMLRSTGAEVIAVTSGKEGMVYFRTYSPNLILLDIMMPDVDGLDVCRQIRRESDVPIVLVSALEHSEMIVEGLSCGADDYITKPVNRNVLQARIQTVLRRADPAARPLSFYEDGYLLVDLDERLIRIREEVVRLSPTEFRLLSHLFLNAGRVCTTMDVLRSVWGEQYLDAPQYVHVYISRLRRKLEKDPENPEYLITEHRVGYRFVKMNPRRA